MRAEKVKEFRSVIDAVVGKQAETQRRLNRSWPDYDKISEAKAAGLTFTVLDENDPRILGEVLLNKERRWAATGRAPYSRYMGYISVISAESMPDTLVRQWEIYSAMDLIPVTTKKILAGEAISQAVDWVRSPHLQLPVAELFPMTEEEQAIVGDSLSDLAASRRAPDEDLRALSEAHHIGWEGDDRIV